ncbi:MAG: ABC transporter permease, partial [Catenulispora sp.]|nr:ABC transporter permease [Catenulispora sp.]
MIDIAKATVRYRWASFVGAFLALALGTAMIGMMALTLTATFGTPFSGPQRFAHATEVVVPRGFADAVLPPPAALPADVVARLTAAGPAVADRSFGAQTPDGPSGMTGHGWSAAAFADYRLTAGRAPAAAGEIVLGGGSAALVGHQVSVTTPAGTQDYQVVGVTNALWFEDAVFFTDAEAALISPPVNTLVLPSPTAGQSAAAAGGRALVLAG